MSMLNRAYLFDLLMQLFYCLKPSGLWVCGNQCPTCLHGNRVEEMLKLEFEALIFSHLTGLNVDFVSEVYYKLAFTDTKRW